jgi:hypothetical protein
MCYWTSGQHYHYSGDARQIITAKEYSMADDSLLTEYLAIAENTTKLSDRRQTVSDLFVGVNSLFLAATGLIAVNNHLTSWWAVIVVAAIAGMAIIINLIWSGLIRRYRALISLRIRYLEGLERMLQANGTFGDMKLVSEDGKQELPATRGIYLIEQNSKLYSKGAKMGFYRLELGLVIVLSVAYALTAVGAGVLTYLVTTHILSPLIIVLPIGG